MLQKMPRERQGRGKEENKREGEGEGEKTRERDRERMKDQIAAWTDRTRESVWLLVCSFFMMVKIEKKRN